MADHGGLSLCEYYLTQDAVQQLLSEINIHYPLKVNLFWCLKDGTPTWAFSIHCTPATCKHDLAILTRMLNIYDFPTMHTHVWHLNGNV